MLPQCSKKGNILQILLLARFEPMTNSRRQESCSYNHSATKLIIKYECSFRNYTTAKFGHFRMAFLALGAIKCKHYLSRPFLHVPIELPGTVAGRNLANLRISEVVGKPRQEFPQQIACCGTLKHFLQLCIMGLFPKNSV